MTIEKAIEILNAYNPEEENEDYENLWPALQLGIQSLKEVQKARYGNPAFAGDLLPGETID